MAGEEPKLTLHIGTGKTGTTLIQATLRAIRADLRLGGLAYVSRSQMKKLPKYARWRAHVGADSKPGLDEWKRGLRALCDSEIEQVYRGIIDTRTVRNGSAP